jgi:hypothetical protein
MVESTEQHAAPEILEEGHIHFAYRPKVRAQDGEEAEVAAEGLGDLQSFHNVLKPHGGRCRLIKIGRRRLPDIECHERNGASST